MWNRLAILSAVTVSLLMGCLGASGQRLGVQYYTNTLAFSPTNIIGSNVLAGTNIHITFGPQGRITVNSTASGGGSVDTNAFQPAHVILTNLSGTGALTNQSELNDKQYGSLTLSNITGTGALTNAGPFQPGNLFLTNISGTGALTNSSGFQPGHSVLSNLTGTGSVTNYSNLGGGTAIVHAVASGVMQFNTLHALGGIVLHTNANLIVISNSIPAGGSGEVNYNEDAGLTNHFTRFGLVYGKTDNTNYLRTLSAGNGFSMTHEGTNIVLNMDLSGDQFGGGTRLAAIFTPSSIVLNTLAASGGLVLHSNNYLLTYSNSLLAQPANAFLTNISGTGALTNQGELNAKQFGSAILTNLSGTGALTNAGPFQPGHIVLSNLVGTGVLTNGNAFQPAHAILTNLSGTGAFTNLLAVAGGLALHTNSPTITISNASAGGGNFIADLNGLGTNVTLYGNSLVAGNLTIGSGGSKVNWNDSLGLVSIENVSEIQRFPTSSGAGGAMIDDFTGGGGNVLKFWTMQSASGVMSNRLYSLAESIYHDVGYDSVRGFWTMAPGGGPGQVLGSVVEIAYPTNSLDSSNVTAIVMDTNSMQLVIVTNNTLLITTNRTARSGVLIKEVRFVASGADRVLTNNPNWRVYGGSTITVPSGKIAILKLWLHGTTEASVEAQYEIQDAVATGSTSPTTTAGDLIVRGTSADIRLGVPTFYGGRGLRSGPTNVYWGGPAKDFVFWDEFVGGLVNPHVNSIGSQGWSATDTTADLRRAAYNMPGVAYLSTPASAGGVYALYAGYLGFSFSNGPTYFQARVVIPVLPAAGQMWSYYIGTGDTFAAGPNDNGVYFFLNTNTTAWQLVTAKGGSRTVTTGISNAVTAPTTLAYVVTESGSQVIGYVGTTENNLSPVATNTTNIPWNYGGESGHNFGNLSGPMIKMDTTTAVARNTFIDYYYLYQQKTDR